MRRTTAVGRFTTRKKNLKIAVRGACQFSVLILRSCRVRNLRVCTICSCSRTTYMLLESQYIAVIILNTVTN